jgi:photosystem II stability/assembly factor-like uncharacterized protein
VVALVGLLAGPADHAAALPIGWAVGTNGTIVHTTDGGTTWTGQSNPLSGTTIVLRGVEFTDATTGWAVGLGGTILHTIDGGSNWIPQLSRTGNDLLSVEFLNGPAAAPEPSSGVLMALLAGGLAGVYAWRKRRPPAAG